MKNMQNTKRFIYSGPPVISEKIFLGHRKETNQIELFQRNYWHDFGTIDMFKQSYKNFANEHDTIQISKFLRNDCYCWKTFFS